MTAQITGYTIEIVDKDGEAAFYAASYPGPAFGLDAATYESFLWDQLDNIVSVYTTELPALAPFHISMVQRNESEGTYLTHP